MSYYMIITCETISFDRYFNETYIANNQFYFHININQVILVL